MVTRRQWKQVFQVLIVASLVFTIIYLLLWGVALLPFRTNYTLDVVYDIGFPKAIKEGGNNISARFDDGDLLNFSSGSSEIVLSAQFWNIESSFLIEDYVILPYWVEMKIRSSVASSLSESWTGGSFDYIYLGFFSLSTTMTTIQLFVGGGEAGNATVNFHFKVPGVNTYFFIEIEYIRLYYTNLSPSQLAFHIGVILAGVAGIFIAYTYLQRKGFFIDTDGKGLERRVELKLRKLDELEKTISEELKDVN